MYARIFQPAPSPVQSGQANLDHWEIEFSQSGKREVDSLTGTYRSTDMMGQLSLKFGSLEEALSYVKARNIPHIVIRPRAQKSIHRAYADNFAFDRKVPWTH